MTRLALKEFEHIVKRKATESECLKNGWNMTSEQIAWCKNYRRETGFEALMDDFLAGKKTFISAAKQSVRWFEDWSSDTMRRIDSIPGDEV